MRHTLSILIFLLTVAVAGCVRPHEYVIPVGDAAWGTAFSNAYRNLSIEEQHLLLGYITRHTGTSEVQGFRGIPEGVTFGVAIEGQRLYLRTAEEQERRQASRRALESAVAVRVLDVFIDEKPDGSGVSLLLEVDNRSRETLARVSGHITVKGLQQNVQLPLTMKLVAAPNARVRQAVTLPVSRSLNAATAGPVTVSAAQFQFNPQFLLYGDGKWLSE